MGRNNPTAIRGVRVTRTAGHLSVAVSRALLDAAGFEEGEVVHVDVDGGRVTVERGRKAYRLRRASEANASLKVRRPMRFDACAEVPSGRMDVPREACEVEEGRITFLVGAGPHAEPLRTGLRD